VAQTALLLEREPNNLQAQSLAQLIEKGVQRGAFSSSPFFLSLSVELTLRGVPAEGYIGMALVGTAAAASAVVAAWLFSPKRR